MLNTFKIVKLILEFHLIDFKICIFLTHSKQSQEEESSPKLVISNLKQIHESIFLGPSLKHKSFGGGSRSKFSILRPKCLIT